MNETIEDQISRLRAMVGLPHVWDLGSCDVAALQMAVRVLSVLQLADRDECRMSICGESLLNVIVDGQEFTGRDNSWLECLAAAGKAIELANGKI